MGGDKDREGKKRGVEKGPSLRKKGKTKVEKRG